MRGEIIEAMRAHEAELTAIRHDIHRHPELGFEETRTAALVAAKLREYGIEVAAGLGGTGVVGTLKGANAGQGAIALRADMDALPIEEIEGRDHRSLNPGKMHACGHDGHTAMLLGAARYLSERPDFAGTVHFVFQPAEEGRGGAQRMIGDGLFERFPVDGVYGLHNMPGVPFGVFATRKGPFLAAADIWTVTFTGSGGHGGASPHLSTDPSLPMAQFVLAMHTIVSRNVPPNETAVVSLGHVGGGDYDAFNVIPSKVVVRGTSRSFKPEIRDLIERRLGELARSAADAYGCKATLDYLRGTPPLVNHAAETDVTLAAARALVGERAVVADAPQVTGAEDFASMLEARPGSFIVLGAGAGPDGVVHGLHTPDYDFNDRLLTLGASYWVSLVQETLGG